MATPRKPNAPAEPVNSEQAAMLELEQSSAGRDPERVAAPGPTTGELEERTAEAEERAEAAERTAATLSAELEELRAQVAILMRQSASPQVRRDLDGESLLPLHSAVPVFDENAPHGTVVGDPLIAYVQDGHQFGRDRAYVATEKFRGCSRPFNPRLVGLVKPRPGSTAVDALDGFRDR